MTFKDHHFSVSGTLSVVQILKQFEVSLDYQSGHAQFVRNWISSLAIIASLCSSREFFCFVKLQSLHKYLRERLDQRLIYRFLSTDPYSKLYKTAPQVSVLRVQTPTAILPYHPLLVLGRFAALDHTRHC